MKENKNGEFRSRVYTERPEYADYEPERKFNTIIGIIGQRLIEHPKAICSYSGGSDSDVLIDLVERARVLFDAAPVSYCFFNTGLEMDATKRHVKRMCRKNTALISRNTSRRRT